MKELRQHIQEELTNNPYVRQYRLEVTQTDTVITMTGIVRCYYHKQMANEAARRVLQNTKTTILFKNEITVLPDS